MSRTNRRSTARRVALATGLLLVGVAAAAFLYREDILSACHVYARKALDSILLREAAASLSETGAGAEKSR